MLVALDQVGRGKGDLLSGSVNAPLNTITSGKSWPRQALEPAMSWNNVDIAGAAYGFKSSFPTEQLGRDYYNLGKGLPVDSTPSQVSGIYTSAANGTNYTGTYTYPASPDATASADQSYRCAIAERCRANVCQTGSGLCAVGEQWITGTDNIALGVRCGLFV